MESDAWFQIQGFQVHVCPAADAICRAVVLVTSSKTLPIAVTVLSQLSVMLGSGIGLAVVPCVVAHLSQIIWDSLLVSSWVRRDAAKRVGNVSR